MPIPPDLPEEVEGAPCHVQLIGRRQKDEALVQHARIVEDVLLK
jgi:Asp-tRNA(Asn)/Glu-tRNA(Gln) amidotransferase A subunit family amidase